MNSDEAVCVPERARPLSIIRRGIGLVVGMADQLLFAGWSFLLLVFATRELSGRDLSVFMIIYLAAGTSTQMLRSVIADPLVLIRSPTRPAALLGGGLGVLLAAAIGALSLASLGAGSSSVWPLCVAVVVLTVAQDSLRALCVACRGLRLAVLSDGLICVAVGLQVATRPDRVRYDLRSVLTVWLGVLAAGCAVGLLAFGRASIEWGVSAWWSEVAGFAKGATLGGMFDLLAANVAFAIPALLGHGEVTSLLTVGRSIFSVPLTLVVAMAGAWTWQRMDAEQVARSAGRLVTAISILAVVGWLALLAALGGSGLSRIFAGSGTVAWSALPQLGLFHASVAVTIACKAILRAARRPGDGRWASLWGDVALVVVVLVFSGASAPRVAFFLALAMVPVALGYIRAAERASVPEAAAGDLTENALSSN